MGVLFVVTGFIGLFIPLLPGAPLLFLGLLLCAWGDGFVHVGAGTILTLALLTGLTYLVELLSSALGAMRYGGSARGMAGAAVGGIVGMLFGLPGIIAGPFIGAVLGELSMQRSLHQAGIAGYGTLIGLAIGLAGKVAIGVAMIGTFLFARFS
ncbi:MAG: DUF456 domain-containing protein [Desulfuromonadia bacterium]